MCTCCLGIIAPLVVGLAHAAGADDFGPQQQRQLKDAEYYLEQVEKELPDITATARRCTENGDGLSLSEVHNCLNKVDWTGGKIDNVLALLRELPQDHEDVRRVGEQVKGLAAALLEAEQTLTAAKARLAGFSDPDAWPELEHDRAVAEGLDRMIADPELLKTAPARAARVCAQLPRARADMQGLRKKYAALLAQPDTLGRSLEAPLDRFDEHAAAFHTAAMRQREALPGLIQQDLDNARAQANRAVADGAGELFCDSVPRFMAWATDKLQLLEILSTDYPEAARMARKNYETTVAEIATLRSGLEAEITASRPAPANAYDGPDRGELTDHVMALWRSGHPQDEILGVRWPMKAWDRHTYWMWQDTTWHPYDYSELHAVVVVKTDVEVATLFGVTCVKDHLEGDTIMMSADERPTAGAELRMLATHFE